MEQPQVERPKRVEHKQIPVGPRRKISEIKDTIPPKYLTCVKDNPKLDECCRDVDTSFISTFRSSPDLPEGTADQLEIQCDQCEKTQYRTFVNVGRLAAPTP